MNIKWPRIEWFGKRKIKIGTFAWAELKEGIRSSSHRVNLKGRDELMTKEPFKLDLQDSLSRYFFVKGKRLKSSGYWYESNTTLFDLIDSGVQEETYSPDQLDVEILDAEIIYSENPGDVWRLYVKRSQSKGKIISELDAFLSNGKRIIRITGPTDKSEGKMSGISEESSYYAFLENGIVLSRVARKIEKIAFEKQTSAMTRSLLLAASISLK